MDGVVSVRARWGLLAGGAMFLCALAGPLRAATTGKIAGEVRDEASQEPIPGGAVSVEALRLGATTDPDGRYFIIGIPPGTYEVTAALVGYAPVTQIDVVVNID